jgi:hypothetical protein
MGFFGEVFAPVPMAEIALAMNNPSKFAETLENSAAAARTTAYFIGNQEIADKLVESADALDDIAGHINSGLEIHKNFKAVTGIYRAWKAINPATISQDPQRAAKAFGSLFANVAVIAVLLPQPLKAYAEFLAGFEDFFSNMQVKLDLESPNMSKSSKLRRAMERDGPLTESDGPI